MLLTKVPRLSPDSAEHRLRVWTVVDKLPLLCRCGSEAGGWGGHQGCGLQGSGQPPRKREGRCPSLGQSVQAALRNKAAAALVFKLCSPAGTGAKPENHLPVGGETRSLRRPFTLIPIPRSTSPVSTDSPEKCFQAL